MKSILVVEDSDDVRESYVRWLEKAGYDVWQARDGEEALRRTEKSAPDVVLLDISLPGIQGYDLAERWQSMPGMATVPLIVLSGKKGEEHERRSRRSGAVITLTKPCSPDLILAALRGAERPAT